MLAEWLLVDRRQLHRVHDLLIDSRLRLLAQQLRQIAFLPAAVRPVDGAIFAHAQEQCIDDDLVQRQHDVSNKKSKHRNEHTRNHVKVHVLAVAQQQNTDQAAERRNGQLAEEQNKVANAVDGGHLQSVRPQCVPGLCGKKGIYRL